MKYSEAIRRGRSKKQLMTLTMILKVDPLLLERLGYLLTVQPKSSDGWLSCNCARCAAWTMFADGKSRAEVADWVEGQEASLEQS